jgi:hypothetical protein
VGSEASGERGQAKFAGSLEAGRRTLIGQLGNFGACGGSSVPRRNRVPGAATRGRARSGREVLSPSPLSPGPVIMQRRWSLG